jgi:hypothetical protein
VDLTTQPNSAQGARDFHAQALDTGDPAKAGQGWNSFDILEQGAHLNPC